MLFMKISYTQSVEDKFLYDMCIYSSKLTIHSTL